MTEHSGAQWCGRFPTSTNLGDLVQPFRDNAAAFISALRASAEVTISATYRPAERAYLMHWCCMIGDAGQDPTAVAPMPGVAIDWTCGGNHDEAKANARAMMGGYNIAFPAALVSRHTQRRAIDMTVRFKGSVSIKDKAGAIHSVASQADLVPIGRSFGVIKLASDPPHWSDDGH